MNPANEKIYKNRRIRVFALLLCGTLVSYRPWFGMTFSIPRRRPLSVSSQYAWTTRGGW